VFSTDRHLSNGANGLDGYETDMIGTVHHISTQINLMNDLQTLFGISTIVNIII